MPLHPDTIKYAVTEYTETLTPEPTPTEADTRVEENDPAHSPEQLDPFNPVPTRTVTLDLDRLDQMPLPGSMFRIVSAGMPIGKPLGPRESALVLEWLESISDIPPAPTAA